MHFLPQKTSPRIEGENASLQVLRLLPLDRIIWIFFQDFVSPLVKITTKILSFSLAIFFFFLMTTMFLERLFLVLCK